MKKYYVFGILMAVVFFATTTMAGFPSINTGHSATNTIVNKGVDTAKNKAIEDDINKKIQSYKCAFKNNTTTTLTTCDLKAVFKMINSKKAPFESLGFSTIYVYGKISGTSKTVYDRRTYVEGVADSVLDTHWWRTSFSDVKDGANTINLYVKSK